MIHHTSPFSTAVVSWEILDADWEVSSPALIDTTVHRPPGRPLFARLNYDEAIAAAERFGGELITATDYQHLRASAVVVLHPYLGTPRAENEIEHSIAHDDYVWDQLIALGWYAGRGAVCGAGKHWIAGAPPGRSRLVGWDKDGDGPGSVLWQPDSVAHNRAHFDDGTTTLIKRRRLRAA